MSYPCVQCGTSCGGGDPEWRVCSERCRHEWCIDRAVSALKTILGMDGDAKGVADEALDEIDRMRYDR